MKNLVTYVLLLMVISCHKQTKTDKSMQVSSTKKFVSVVNHFEDFNSGVNDNLKPIITKLDKSFEGNYLSYYAGYTINRSNNNLIILIAGDDTSKYRDEFAKRLESNQFSMDYGKYAYQELLNVKKTITDYINTHKKNNVTQNIEHFDIYGNKVIVYLKDNSYQKASEFRKEITDSPAIGLTKKNRYPGGIAE